MLLSLICIKNRVCIFNEKKASLAVFPSFEPDRPQVRARAEPRGLGSKSARSLSSVSSVYEQCVVTSYWHRAFGVRRHCLLRKFEPSFLRDRRFTAHGCTYSRKSGVQEPSSKVMRVSRGKQNTPGSSSMMIWHV